LGAALDTGASFTKSHIIPQDKPLQPLVTNHA
jgi:hypothetical protein